MKSSRSWIVTAVVVPVLLASALTLAAAAGGWSTNLTAAIATAGTTRQPVLAWFTATWCGPCKLMASTTLTNAAVEQALAKLHCVTIDIDEHRDLTSHHNVRAVPTFVMLSSGGDEVARTTGYQSADDFLSWFTNSVAQARETDARRERIREQLRDVDRLIAAGDEASVRAAAAQLLDICAERDSAGVETAVAGLRKLAQTRPRVVLEGLRHPRLAARIHAANVLRDTVGDTFDADPWSDAAARDRAIAEWSSKLAR